MTPPHCQTLEPRRLLAAVLDLSYGADDGLADGISLIGLGLPATATVETAAGFEREYGNSVEILTLAEIGSGPDAGYLVAGQSDSPYSLLGGPPVPGEAVEGVAFRSDTLLALADAQGGFDLDGQPVPLFTPFDSQPDGTASEEFLATNFYQQTPLRDGSTLATRFNNGDITNPVPRVLRLNPDGTIDDDYALDTSDFLAVQGTLVSRGIGDRGPFGLLYGNLDEGFGPYAARPFDLDTGAFIGPAFRPFGQARPQIGPAFPNQIGFFQSYPDTNLAVGVDGSLYATSQRARPDAPSGDTSTSDRPIGLLVTRATPRVEADGSVVYEADASFGEDATFDGQFVKGAFLSYGDPLFRAASTLGNNVLAVTGTADGRPWLYLGRDDPIVTPSLPVLTLLNADGTIDRSLGEDGTGAILVRPDGQESETGRPSDLLANYPVARARASVFATRDGGVVGLFQINDEPITIIDGFNIPNVSLTKRLGVFGLTPEGTFDARVAGADSPAGLGRAVVEFDLGAAVAAESGRSYEAHGLYDTVATLDDDGRVVLAGTLYSGDDVQAIDALRVNRSRPSGESYRDVRVDVVTARIVLGAPRAEVVEGEDGRRVLRVEGGAGDDVLTLGTDGAGRIVVSTGFASATPTPAMSFDAGDVDAIELLGGDGADVLLADGLPAVLIGRVFLRGGAGDDTITGGNLYDRLFGDDGDDSLRAGGLANLLYGGAGNDTLRGSIGRDLLDGGDGADELDGGDGGDLLDGGAGDDALSGGDGDDTLLGSAGDDEMDGGDGTDLLSFARGRGDADLSAGTAAYFDGDDDAAGTLGVESVENLLGGDGPDVLIGDDGRNFIVGGAGDDTLGGGGGKDTLLGGEGSDDLDGGDDLDLLIDLDAVADEQRPDRFVGGGGRDLAFVRDAGLGDFAGVERVFDDLDELLANL